MFNHSFSRRHRHVPVRTEDSRAIVFVDTKVSNYAAIIQQISPEARAFILDLRTDGIKSITQILTTSMCHEVHIVGTGLPGCIYLGSQELSINTLIQYENELENWFDAQTKKTISSFVPASSWIDSLAIVPRISFYGCNLAAGDVGAEFINRLSQTTKAQISASRDILRHEVFYNGERKSQS